MAKKIKDTDYLTISACVRAMETGLLTRERMEQILEARSDEEAAKILQECGYPALDPKYPEEMDAALARVREETLADLAAGAPDAGYLDIFKLKYDYHNAKVLLKAAAMGTDPAHMLTDMGRVSAAALREAVESGRLEELPPCLASALEEAKEVLDTTRDPQRSDMVLDRWCYRDMMAAAEATGSSFLQGYVRAQIDQLIKDLCEFTGKTWDEERFKEIMKISQRNSYLWERANDLLHHKPAPIGGFELFNYMSAMVCNRGKTSTTAIMEQLNAEMEENIRKGTSTFPVEQEYRVSWDGIACWPYLSHNLRTLKKHGVNMVASSYGKAWAIEYEDLDGMARAYCFASTNGDNATTMLSRRLEALKRFDCDGTIYHVNRSCKVMDCQMMEVQRQLSEMAGVPFTSFDGDQADYRNYSEAQFETRIEGLVEIMKQNKEAKGNG